MPLKLIGLMTLPALPAAASCRCAIVMAPVRPVTVMWIASEVWSALSVALAAPAPDAATEGTSCTLFMLA